MACPFCEIVAGRLDASVVAQTERALAFLDLRQAVSGHVLVIPKAHVEDIYAIDAGLAGEVMQLGVRVARALREAFHPPGLNLWQSNGKAGGQEVPHFHLHVQPRRVADGLLRVYADGVPAPSRRIELDDMALRIRRFFTYDDGVFMPPRSP
ncbi:MULTISPECIES: HIT family protein [unclassified Dyella]|uniref:HIT family protein n=1 Tax=unclassified Dyella TaxID=2634549 RepID=UPI000C85CFFA|nr:MULTISPECIES: HIT family protein [unclassified Dyella]MDR3446415.1 HIT family protein [Dyella sp.]PMQ07489.1 putative HIT-like protein [Dyella sp. AD56]